tara:strand:+ start:261 stop:509 length:249 start_codon:yes stop_codon:yes gene_type:complete
MWKKRKEPLRLERRFEFDNYKKTSEFVKDIDCLCKESKIYPNMSFGSNFVSVTIFLELEEISIKEEEFASDIDQKFKNLSSN